MKNKKIYIILGIVICVLTFSVIALGKNKEQNAVATNSTLTLSNKKIGWGIKRGVNNEQPDLGKVNKDLIEKYDGLAMGNKEEKNIYLTFDEGYEAGYTSEILDVLKENDVKATFFITAHYLNTAPELVQRMIDEGHIVGNHISVKPMYLKEKSYES